MAWGLHDVYTWSAPTARASNTAQVSSAMPKTDVTRIAAFVFLTAC